MNLVYHSAVEAYGFWREAPQLERLPVNNARRLAEQI